VLQISPFRVLLFAVRVYLFQEGLLLPHNLSHQVEAFPNLVLFYVDVPTVGGHSVKVLLNLKRNLLRKLVYNLVHPSALEPEIFILHDFQKLPIAPFKEKFALFFKKRGVKVVFSKRFVLQVNNAYTEWEINDTGELLDGFLDIVNEPSVKDIEYEVSQCMLILPHL
jgi:hypothetical protein